MGENIEGTSFVNINWSEPGVREEESRCYSVVEKGGGGKGGG